MSNSIKTLSHEIGGLEAKELEMIETLQATLNEHRRLNELSQAVNSGSISQASVSPRSIRVGALNDSSMFS